MLGVRAVPVLGQRFAPTPRLNWVCLFMMSIRIM